MIFVPELGTEVCSVFCGSGATFVPSAVHTQDAMTEC